MNNWDTPELVEELTKIGAAWHWSFYGHLRVLAVCKYNLWRVFVFDMRRDVPEMAWREVGYSLPEDWFT